MSSSNLSSHISPASLAYHPIPLPLCLTLNLSISPSMQGICQSYESGELMMENALTVPVIIWGFILLFK